MLAALILGCNNAPPEPPADFAGRLDVVLDGGWSAEPWAGPERAGTIQTTFTLPAERVGVGSRLVLEGLWWSATVTVNGQKLDPVTGGDVAVNVALGGNLRPGDNTLIVEVHGSGDTPLAVSHDGLSRRLSAADGPWLIEPPRLELRGAAFVERAWLVAEGDTVQPRAVVVGAPEGASVRFSAAADGTLIQALGEAAVSDGAVVGAPTAWSGPRWSPQDAGLVMLRAELLVDGEVVDVAAVRTGVRALSVDGPRLRLDDAPLPLLAGRVSRAEKRPLARWLRTVSGSGINAVEFHGQLVRERDLEVADALGLPVVVMGRCAGRSPDLLSLTPPWLAALDAHDARLAAFLAAHPSVVLLALEEHGTPTEHGARLARPSLRQWPGRPPMTGVELPAAIAAFRDGGLVCQESDCGLAWITEIFDDSLGDAAWPEAADALNERIIAGATGGVAPLIPPAGANARPPTVAHPLSPQVPASGQRADSLLALSGGTPGALAVLEVPLGRAVGAFVDASGSATLSAWHRGEARLTVGDEVRAVTLTPRRWQDFTERGATTTVGLAP
jgi:hypothetical protein